MSVIIETVDVHVHDLKNSITKNCLTLTITALEILWPYSIYYIHQMLNN